MLVDADQIPAEFSKKLFDVCIVGAGAAGITTANKLAASGHEVVILEGGGQDFEDKSQELYTGEVHNFLPLEVNRLRFFGGTTNHWGGMCRPLDELDFQVRKHVDFSGWPITKGDLVAYENKAADILKIDHKGPISTWAPAKKPFLKGDSLTNIGFRFARALRFREEFGPQLAASRRITVLLNCNALNTRRTQDRDHVNAIECRNYRIDENRFDIRSRVFVLCMGAIENARFLLNDVPDPSHDKKNGHDFIGNFLMEHPHLKVGYFILKSWPWPLNGEMLPNLDGEWHFMSPSKKFQELNRILNCSARLIPYTVMPRKNTARFAERLRQSLEINMSSPLSPEIENWFDGEVYLVSEQAPAETSNLVLSDKIDRFGQRKLLLRYSLNDISIRTLKVVAKEVAKQFAMQDLGRVRLKPWVFDERPIAPPLGFGGHHMGTTRMADSPSTGVCDRDGKKFGTDNLFLGGASVFPTGGHANPTFTIVQMSLRLADHLNTFLRSRR